MAKLKNLCPLCSGARPEQRRGLRAQYSAWKIRHFSGLGNTSTCTNEHKNIGPNIYQSLGHVLDFSKLPLRAEQRGAEFFAYNGVAYSGTTLYCIFP